MTPAARATLPGTQVDAAPAPSLGRRLPPGVQRLLTAALHDRDRLWGWLAPLTVAIIGGVLRFWHLGRPPWLVFDETYYVKQGASMITFGYERAVRQGLDKPDVLWNAGTTDVWGERADFVVHPPAGKWLIGLGQLLFGSTEPVGWRFASAVVGTASILMLGRIARRLLGSTLLGTTAALLLAVDGQHFVHSRTGLLDVFVMFWALAGFGCLLVDRDQARARLAAGEGTWIRPWRLAAGACLGMCTATKWSGLFFVAAFSIASLAWDVAARRASGRRHWVVTALFRDGVGAFVHLVPTVAVVYLLSWAGWFRSADGYNRQWAAEHPAEGAAGLLPGAVRSLWDYHQQMWRFNTTLHTPHAYQSHPWSWIVLGRPTAFDYRSYRIGERGCRYSECSRAVTDLGNPVIWWGAAIAIAVLLVVWALGRDWRAGAILAGLAGGWLPWFLWDERTIYTFYAVAFVPYVVLALTFCLGLVLGPRDASPDRRLVGAGTAGGVVLLAVLAFAFFYPVLSDQLISHQAWVARMWLPSWI
ncbi:MAG: phospholipid carrier-dependent glycosyltransferase [Kineosporiaceae bacterium]|nr:phospholipid carrier-dependent glycosyltransferase [Kineosporiaceae bacterium]